MLILAVVVVVLITGGCALIWQDTLAVGAFAVAVMLLVAVVAGHWGAAVIETLCLMVLACYGLCAGEMSHERPRD